MDDHKEGRGVFKWPNGRTYDGNWKLGKMDGEGTYTSEKGKVRIGIWQDGKRLKWVEYTDSATKT